VGVGGLLNLAGGDIETLNILEPCMCFMCITAITKPITKPLCQLVGQACGNDSRSGGVPYST
jgi:hypothetical protein